MEVSKAVIPAAGFGTRFLPVTKAQPKEMMPVLDKPTIQYVVEEAVQAGIHDILIITGRGKQAIERKSVTGLEMLLDTQRIMSVMMPLHSCLEILLFKATFRVQSS
jgi:UTP-glucose-1-phosphate uridylyltransferase